MAKILLICFRDKNIDSEKVQRIKNICESLNPDNIQPIETKVVRNNGVLFGVSNPVDSISINESGVLLGQVFGTSNWSTINEEHPEGNYSIFRFNESKLEILSDVLGTRSVWYFQDSEVLIASTSQRAIIQYLGNFLFNEEVIPWMLCNGLLGPNNSWDKRIKLLPPDSILKINRSNWELTVKQNPLIFATNNKTDKENIQILKEKIDSSLSEMSLDYSKWDLTLSGGFDSRGILGFLPRKDNAGNVLKAITWGLKGRDLIRGNDAFIAAKIAEEKDVPHQYFNTNSSNESLELILERFFKNGEGRIDHIAGYMDGFALWKILFENDIQGAIRGDEVFGSYNFISHFHLKSFIGISLPSDYDNLRNIPYLKAIDPKLPEEFRKKSDESFEVYRDRLYQSYLVPVFLSALSDLKQPYLEQVNPLLSRRIVEFVREMPDHLRTEKYAFRKIVKSLKFSTPMAKEPAIESIKNIFQDEEMVGLIKQELTTSEIAKTIFPPDFINESLSKIQVKQSSNSKSVAAYIKMWIPKSLKRKILKQTFSPKLNDNILVFRMFLICRMIEIFEADIKDQTYRRL